MSNRDSIQQKGVWVTIIFEGTMYERYVDVMVELEKGDSNSAKITEGSDHQGNKYVFIMIKNYKP